LLTSPKPLPTGRVGRTARLAGLAGHTMATRAQTRLHGGGSSQAAEAAERARQERLAERYAEVLGDMKGAVMNVGQILSFVDADGVIPASSRQLMHSLQWKSTAIIVTYDENGLQPLGHRDATATPLLNAFDFKLAR
jgi:predicted unusual protein kinase regulating ubiquinone biosynthesis (AarF/ABC1/UbiB family)